MTDEEKASYMYGATMGAEYLQEIKNTDLATLTPDQVLTFAECVCKNYHNKIIELELI